MMDKKKEDFKAVSPFIEPRNLDEIANKTGNLYESINVICRRSEQLNNSLKEELHKKLEEFASHTDNLEEVFENREQIEISRFYEKMPKVTIQAINEFLGDELRVAYKEAEE